MPWGAYSPRRFRVVAEGEFADVTEIWASCSDVKGFFGSPEGRRLMKLLDASASGPILEFCAGRRRGDNVRSDAYLQVLDHSDKVIGQYFIVILSCTVCELRMDILGSNEADGEPQPRYDVTLEIMADPETPLVKQIWEEWYREMPSVKNLWSGYPTEGRMAWLDVVRNHATFRASSPDRSAGRAFDLDGLHITDYPGFYCAIGEAINGPGGYFGGNLDALNDCLRGRFGATTPFTLRWHDFSVAAQHLGKPLYGEDSLCGEPPLEYFAPNAYEESDVHEMAEDMNMDRPYLDLIIEVLEEKSVTIVRD